jgi:hypothetical protein
MTMCPFDRTAGECGCTLELIWDEDLNATALTGAASPIRIGPAVNLLPHQLLALAASSSLMTSFLELAAASSVPVQGYVSSARLREGADGEPELALAPCVVVSSEEDGRLVAQLWPEVVRHSRTLGLLRDRVRVEPAVRVAPPP